MKSTRLTTLELKFFLYFQSICLFFAAIGLGVREYMVFEAKEVFHWYYIAILLFILLGFLFQYFDNNKIKKFLINFGIHYAFVSMLLTIVIYFRF